MKGNDTSESSPSDTPSPSTGLSSTVLHPSPKGSRPYRNPLRSRLRKMARVAPKGPHPEVRAGGYRTGPGGGMTSIRSAIRAARNQLRDAEREAHLSYRAMTLPTSSSTSPESPQSGPSDET